MTNINPNIVVSMPSQLFTLARSMKAAANGKIFIGKIDSDPTIPENQVQVYIENEEGGHTPVPQPLIINQAGYPVHDGKIVKFVTVEGHSMAVFDAFGSQQFYFPNVLKYEPDQFRQQLTSEGGASVILTNNGKTVQDELNEIPNVFSDLISDVQLYDVNIHKNIEYYIAKMKRGEKLKIAAFGDSTVDGDRTSSWHKNAVDIKGNAVGATNHNAEAPNSWPVILESLLRDMFSNKNIFVHNAGYGGRAAITGWAISNYDRAITNNPHYGKCDICFVDFGLNDMATPKFNVDTYRESIVELVKYILSVGTLPILLSSDSTLYNSADSVRDAKDVALIVNRTKENIAAEFGIPYINKHDIVKNVLSNSSENWISAQWDNLHFGDLGHRVKASVIAAHLYSDIYYADKTKYISPFDSRSNSQFLGYKISKPRAKFGGNLYIPPSVVNARLGAAMIDAWLWSDIGGDYIVYNSIMSDGNNNGDGGGCVLSIKNISLNKTIYNDTTYLNSTGNAPSLYTDYPAIYGRLLPGLNRIRYAVPLAQVTSHKWCGYFELVKDIALRDSTKFIQIFNKNMWLVDDFSNLSRTFLSKKTTVGFTAKLANATGIVVNAVNLLDLQNKAGYAGLMLFRNNATMQAYTVYRNDEGGAFYTLLGNFSVPANEGEMKFIVQTQLIDTGIKMSIYLNETLAFSDTTTKNGGAKYPLSGYFGGYYVSTNAPKSPHQMYLKDASVEYEY